MVDLYLGSSLIDFHISTDKLSWLLLRGVTLFKSRFKAWSSHSKRLVMTPVIPISNLLCKESACTWFRNLRVRSCRDLNTARVLLSV